MEPNPLESYKACVSTITITPIPLSNLTEISPDITYSSQEANEPVRREDNIRLIEELLDKPDKALSRGMAG